MDFSSHDQLLGVFFVHYQPILHNACIYILNSFHTKQTTTWPISFILNSFHSVCISKDCMIFVQQYSLKAVQGCVVRPAKIPHHVSLQLKSLIFYYIRRPSACNLNPQTIPSSHHLTHWALVNNYSRTYSQLGILSYIFLSSLSQKYIYKSTSLTFTYKSKTRRIAC